LVAVANKRLRRRAAQPVRAAGDEGERHQLLLSMSIQNGRCAVFCARRN
jgi:hypothetical protein